MQSHGDDATRRIVLVAPVPPPYGGMALQALLLARLLRQDGYEVVVFASNFSFPASLCLLEKLPVLRTIARAIMIWPKLWKCTARAEVVHVLAASWLYFFLVVYPAGIVARLRGARFILNYRGGEAERFFRYFGWAAQPIFRVAHAVTAPSAFLAGPIRKHFAVAVSIVPNVLDGLAFQFRTRLTIQPRMLVTRHLETIYGVETVLKAFRLVQERYPEASLWIAGTGTQEETLRKLAREWNLMNIRFLGRVEHSRLPEIYDQCDILLNASTVDNFPGALVEGSAAGLVVISTNAGGIPFVYEHRRSALLVEPGDWEGLAGAIEEVLRTPSLAANIIAEGAAIARACDWADVRKPLYLCYGFPDKMRNGIQCIAG
jgi:glycosyltransferase involved in cell wall biosynthesis